MKKGDWFEAGLFGSLGGALVSLAAVAVIGLNPAVAYIASAYAVAGFAGGVASTTLSGARPVALRGIIKGGEGGGRRPTGVLIASTAEI